MTWLRALHLFGNFKWTGPADPAIRTAAGLRTLGADVVFTQARFVRGGEHFLEAELRRGRMPVTGDLQLPKHFKLLAGWRDGKALAARLRRGDFNLLHSHLPGDHLTAALAKRLAGSGTLLVRSLYDPAPPVRDLRNRFAFALTNGVVVPTRQCGEQLAERFGIPEDRILLQEPTTDVHRFDGIDRRMRERWQLGPEHVVLGITARVQPHRRFLFLWDVLRRVADAVPSVRFVLLGRGSEEDLKTLVHDPIAQHGLEGQVILPGYLREPEYSQALRALDLFLFLVPGSDGTCRAVREALAAGLPVVTTKRGILPELVGRRHDGDAPEPCGLSLEEDVDVFSDVLVKLINNPDARGALSRAALSRVRGLMEQGSASRRLLAFYDHLRESGS